MVYLASSLVQTYVDVLYLVQTRMSKRLEFLPENVRLGTVRSKTGLTGSGRMSHGYSTFTDVVS